MVTGELKEVYTVIEGYVNAPPLPIRLIKAVLHEAGGQSALIGVLLLNTQ